MATETMSEVEVLRKELADLKKALAAGKDMKALQPVKVSLTYLCPKDPNYKKIVENEGVVMPDDGPQHLGGYIIDIRNEETKKWIVGPDGKNMLVPFYYQTAKWLCATANCGGTIKLDPYRV